MYFLLIFAFFDGVLFGLLVNVVCIRIVRSFKSPYSAHVVGEVKKNPKKLFEQYCGMDSSLLSVEDQRFCYNSDNIRQDLYRLLDMGADEFRVCKRFKKANAHFCESKTASTEVVRDFSLQTKKRGVVFE